nr:helitron helicase-like domain-containing protein [Tanacetum cinerariifolium]
MWKRCGGCAIKVPFGNDVVVVLKLDGIESTIYHCLKVFIRGCSFFNDHPTNIVMKWKRKLLPKTNNDDSSNNPISVPTHLSHRDESLRTFVPNDSSHVCPTIELSVITPEVVQPDIHRPLQLLNSISESPVEGIRDSASRCVKRKSPFFSSPDAFTRYSELCGRNVLAKSSLDISPAVKHPDFNSSEPLRLNITETDGLLDDRTHLNTPITGVFRLNDGASSFGQAEGFILLLLSTLCADDSMQSLISFFSCGVCALFFWVFTNSILFDGIIDNVSKKTQRTAPVVESSSKTPRYTARKATDSWIANVRCHDGEGCNAGQGRGKLYGYVDLGDYNQQCQHCGAAFWLGECLKGHFNYRTPEYHLCCGRGRIHMQPSEDPPEYFKDLLQNKHFMDNFRAYNQMFAMTSFRAKIDESNNDRRGPYVFKVSGQVYHWIGSLCPPLGESPRFLQLYIYDMDHEVENRMRHFGGIDHNELDPEIVKGLIHFLDAHNQLVQLFRTARDKCREIHIPEFKIRLYNAEGACGYELLASNVLGAVVFDSGVSGTTDFDVIIQEKAGPPKRISKLHKSYLSLQFPLLFIYGKPGFYPELKLRRADGSRQEQKLTMLAYYSYQLHPRVKDYNLIFRTGRLFQQYVVGVYCAIEQSRLDYIRKKQKDIRGDQLSGLYDAISRVLYTVEFQKRGLPHCHTLLWVHSENKIKQAEDVDQFISPELPDLKIDPEGYRVVFDLMMHGPCGAAKMSAPCMKSDKCSKKFPKKYMPHTFFDDKGHVYYQRRDTSIFTTKHHFSLDNSHVVPYNRALLLAFEAHINVEYYGWSMLIKYLSKYILKGTDRIFAWVSKPLCELSNAPGPSLLPIDKIQNYLEGRDRDNLESIVNLLGRTSTTLTEWFTYNEANEDGRHLTYQDFPSEFVCALRSKEKILLAVASSGITSLLLPSGRTAHSRFKLPLELIKESLCRITKNTHMGKLLANTDLIIWDEAPMNDRFFTLTQNMRLEKPNISADEHSLISSFASWLLNIGDRNMGDPDPEDPENTSWVDIPINYYIPDDEKGLQNLINFIYDQNTLQTPSVVTLQQKAIVCPKNETADTINSKVLEMVQGETKIYLSHDEARPIDNNGAETEMLYPVEHLNTLKLLEYPPHRLELKVGAHVMLLWNVNVAGGLCNETRMIVKQTMTKLIEVQIITDTRVGEKSVSGITHFKDPNRSEKTIRKIDIENLNGNIVEFTLWDEMAEHFGQAKLETMEHPVIIAVSSCRVSKYRGNKIHCPSNDRKHQHQKGMVLRVMPSVQQNCNKTSRQLHFLRPWTIA